MKGTKKQVTLKPVAFYIEHSSGFYYAHTLDKKGLFIRTVNMGYSTERAAKHAFVKSFDALTGTKNTYVKATL